MAERAARPVTAACEHSWFWNGAATCCYKCKVPILDLLVQLTRERDEARAASESEKKLEKLGERLRHAESVLDGYAHCDHWNGHGESSAAIKYLQHGGYYKWT